MSELNSTAALRAYALAKLATALAITEGVEDAIPIEGRIHVRTKEGRLFTINLLVLEQERPDL